MTPSEANRIIAEAMGEQGWEQCIRCQGRCVHPTADCPTCSGTGRVPKDWGDESRTLELAGWRTEQVGVDLVMSELDQALVCLPDVAQVGIDFRDLIAEALEKNNGHP